MGLNPYVGAYTWLSGAAGMQVIAKRHGRRFFKHIGSARTDVKLAVLLARAEQVAAGDQTALDLDEHSGTARLIKSGAALMSSTRSALLVKILQHTWYTLGLGTAVGGDEGFN